VQAHEGLAEHVDARKTQMQNMQKQLQQQTAQMQMQVQQEQLHGKQLPMNSAAVTGHPPPMTEEHCRHLVYQHVVWLQQRSGASVGPPAGGAAGAADARMDVADGAAGGAPAGKEGQAGESVDSAAIAGAVLIAAASGATVGAVQRTGANTKALNQAKALYKEGILSRDEYEQEQAKLNANTKKGRAQQVAAVRFDRYHTSLYHTVLNILTPCSLSPGSEHLAWELINEVIDPNHIVAKRWRIRIGVAGLQIGNKSSLKKCEHGLWRKNQVCWQCDKMKMEVVSIIYSITAQFEGLRLMYHLFLLCVDID